jgi:hypothetical protein
MADLLKHLIQALANGGIEDPPAGWQTAQQIADESRKSLSRTKELLRAAVRADLIEVRSFRIRTGNKLYPVPHYRKKKTPDHSGA